MASWEKFAEYYKVRSLRERLILLVALAGLLLFSFDRYWFDPANTRRDNLEHNILRIGESVSQLDRELADVSQWLSKDTDEGYRQRISRLEEEVHDLDRGLREASLVLPEQMVQVLTGMLSDLPLTLTNLELLPPEPYFENKKGAPGIKIYRHKLRIQFSGNFADTRRYVERLEQSSWKLAWSYLDIETQEYPNAKVIIEVYTVSSERPWIGV